jgi:GntR family transcriptional regulator of arabinose operon
MIFQLTRQVLEQQGKRVPEDCSLVCFDYSSSDWETEGVTCSVHQGYRIGQEVAARLMRMIRNRDCDDKGYTHVLPPEIYLGRTVGPAREAR